MKRPPIAVVMGHIDHGKTTLLDKIRQTNVAGKESGGITQHFGAYEIEVQDKKITFIDTPGHEAFSKMRSRGAKVADLALLVVAADEGVKPQTEEALRVIQEVRLPFIVVLNKIDKASADPERVMKELGEKGVIFEGWGGKVPAAKISAKTGEGVPELMELILLLADLENLEADFSKPASGVVIESRLDSKRGQAATLLIQEGKLEKGQWVSADRARVKIKILEDAAGGSLDEAFPSSPVLAVGFDRTVKVGTAFRAFNSKEELEEALAGEPPAEILHRPSLGEEKKTIPLILRADVSGSLEVLESQTKKIETRDFSLIILRSEVGSITEDDIKLASANKNSLVLGFRVKLEKGAKILAERFGVRFAIFDLIYDLETWLKTEVGSIVGEEKIAKISGRAAVLKIFREDGSRKILGGRMESGRIFPQARFTLLRRDFPLGEGKILELQVGKAKVKEVLSGNEFGALADISLQVASGDKLEIFEIT